MQEVSGRFHSRLGGVGAGPILQRVLGEILEAAAFRPQQGEDGLGRHRRLRREDHADGLAAGVDLSHPQGPGLDLEIHHREQPACLRRDRPEAVSQLLGEVPEAFGIRDGQEALVQIQPEGGVGDVALREEPLGAQANDGVHRDLGRLPLQLANRVLDELGVQVETHGRNVARLLRSQEVSRPPDLQVPGGDLEAGAQLGQLRDHLQAPARHLGHAALGRDQEVRMGPVLVPAHPPAELVQLRQPQGVRPVDDDGVGRGDVQPRLDDGGAEEDVHLLQVEVHHDPLQCRLLHLAMGHGQPRLGHQPLQVPGRGLDGLHAVVHVEDLPAPLELALNRLGDDLGVVGGHVGPDGQALLRRRLDRAGVPHPQHGHVQGPRDGRGRQREHVHLAPQLFERLLGGHAEALLLVHHEQAERVERDVLLEQAVRADHDVHAAIGKPSDHLRLLRDRAEPRQGLHPDGEVGEAGAEGLVVLQGQDRRGDQDGDLFAVHDGLEGGAQRHLGFAVAHVPAHQPVHGPGRLHVPLHVPDGLELVGRLLVGEGRLELLLPGPIEGEGVAGHDLARGIQPQELSRHLPHAGPHPLLGLRPRGAAQSVQRGAGPAGLSADIPLHQLKLGDGDVEPVGAGVPQVEKVSLLAAHRELPQAQVLGDAVVHVHDIVALLQVLEGGEGQRLLGPRAPARQQACPEDLRLRDDGEAQRLDAEARAQATDPESDPARLGHLPRKARPQVVIPQDLLQALRLGLASCHQRDPLPTASPRVQVLEEARDAPLVSLDARGRDVLGGPGLGPRPGRGRERLQDDPWPGPRRLAKFRPGDPPLLKRWDQGGQIRLPPARRVPDGTRALRQSRRLVPDDQARGGKVGQDGGEVRHEVRQEGVPFRDRAAVLQRLQERRRNRNRLPPRHRPQALLRGGHRHLGHRDLGERQDRHGRFRPEGPLGLGIEPPEGVDLVPEELDPHRVGGLRWEAVQDAAPDGELSRLRHLADGTVTRRREDTERFVPRDDPLRVQRQRRGSQRRGPDRPGKRGGDRRHQDGCLSRAQPMQGLDPPGPRVGVSLSLRQQGHPVAQEALQVGRQRRGHLVGPTEDQKRPARPGVARRHGQRTGRPVQLVEADLAPRGEIFEEIRQFGFAPEELRQHDRRRSGWRSAVSAQPRGGGPRGVSFGDRKACVVHCEADG